MKREKRLLGFLVLIALLTPSMAAAQMEFNRIIVFGTSLSDPGNRFALEGGVTTPPYDFLLTDAVPTAAYAVGGHHFSNGPTWIEQLARSLKLAQNAQPAFAASAAKASNYAVGGARARDLEGYKNFSWQVGAFVKDFNGAAPSDALYIIEFGSNDIRDVLSAILENPESDPLVIAGGIIKPALETMAAQMYVLHSMGAQKFLVCNAPDFSLTPAVPPPLAPGVQIIVKKYNEGLAYTLTQLKMQLSGVQIVEADFFQMVNDMADSQADSGFTVVKAPCLMPNTPPYHCQNPDQYLFWDGAHPTTAAHGIIAQKVAQELVK